MKRKNIWILNHYATNMFYEATGRHHGLAKYLVRMGYEVTIFCANTIHNRDESITLNDTYAIENGPDNVKYVFVKTCPYQGNGLSRIKNMLLFAYNLVKVSKKNVGLDKPDLIIASSVHPLTLVSGIIVARRLKVPCICEIRDIWPLSLVDFKIISEKSLINKALQFLEKWIYKKADKVIFTMAGGKEYISDMGWSKCIPEEKILYLNNGVDLELFDQNITANMIKDEDLEAHKKNFIYTGSIGMTDKLERLVNLAERCKQENLNDVVFLVYGSGSEKESLEELCVEKGLSNIKFKGRVKKEQIPYILSKSYANIFFLEDLKIYKYGISLNKFFEYLAAGKPIITNLDFGYNQIKNNRCGFTSEDIFESVKTLCLMEHKEYESLCKNARIHSNEYSFKYLAEKLEYYIKSVEEDRYE